MKNRIILLLIAAQGISTISGSATDVAEAAALGYVIGSLVGKTVSKEDKAKLEAEHKLVQKNLEELKKTNACPGCFLAKVNLSGVKLEGANLTGANLTDASLINAKLGGANLTGANLTETSFSGANLTDANLTNATLKNTRCTKKDFTHKKETTLPQGYKCESRKIVKK
jgi:uncharacterized protein YjbI with pentapeptide repeats